MNTHKSTKGLNGKDSLPKDDLKVPYARTDDFEYSFSLKVLEAGITP